MPPSKGPALGGARGGGGGGGGGEEGEGGGAPRGVQQWGALQR